MSTVPFDPKTILRRKMWIPIGAAIVLALAAWIVALAALGGKNLLSSTPVDDSVQHLYLIMALMVTIVGIPVAYLAVRNIQILLTRGVVTTAAVESISSVSKGGTRPVTFSYVADGKPYRIKRDVPGLFVKEYRSGTRVKVIYDPNEPSRCHPLFKAM
jgi:hypothetical protein